MKSVKRSILHETPKLPSLRQLEEIHRRIANSFGIDTKFLESKTTESKAIKKLQTKHGANIAILVKVLDEREEK